MEFTKFYTPAIEVDGVHGAVFALEDFEEIMEKHPRAHALRGMMLLEDDFESEIVEPSSGANWLKIIRGSSWLHTQNGWICAGAGGLNSMRVRKLNEKEIE